MAEQDAELLARVKSVIFISDVHLFHANPQVCTWIVTMVSHFMDVIRGANVVAPEQSDLRDFELYYTRALVRLLHMLVHHHRLGISDSDISARVLLAFQTFSLTTYACLRNQAMLTGTGERSNGTLTTPETFLVYFDASVVVEEYARRRKKKLFDMFVSLPESVRDEIELAIADDLRCTAYLPAVGAQRVLVDMRSYVPIIDLNIADANVVLRKMVEGFETVCAFVLRKHPITVKVQWGMDAIRTRLSSGTHSPQGT